MLWEAVQWEPDTRWLTRMLSAVQWPLIAVPVLAAGQPSRAGAPGADTRPHSLQWCKLGVLTQVSAC
jgi:hypothetical protein